MQLNKEQQEAAKHYMGPCIVTAVPGSGKTSVLTSRVISLINERGVEPRNILCLTFTNKAADEMKERIASKLNNKEKSKAIWVSTFHRLCLAILRKHGHFIGIPSNFSVYSQKEQNDLIEKISRMNGYDTDKDTIYKLSKLANDVRENIMDSKQQEQELNFLEIAIIKEYQKQLDELKAVDFSGMLYKAWLLLKKNPDVLHSMSNRFQFVLVDEFQDTNEIQYDIVKLISSHKNVFVVGDFQQSVYSWRGAKPENMKHFLSDFSGSKTIVLPSNYRSLDPILRAAESLIRNNHDAVNVVLKTERPENGPAVNIWQHMNSEQESDKVVDRIVQLKNMGTYSWKDFAILYRVNSLSRSPEMALRNRGIPYSIVGGFSFFDRAEIKTTMSYLALLVNPYDTINFARAITNPKRGIGPEAIGKLEVICSENNCSIIDLCNNVNNMPLSMKVKSSLSTFGHLFNKYSKEQDSLSNIARRLLNEAGYLDYLANIDKDESSDKSRLDNVEELIAGIAEYEANRPGSTFSDYLHSIHLSSEDFVKEDETDTIKLLTMHSAKGREWPCVEIIGVEKGCIPHARSVKDGNIEEERRLLYVAMTRAKDYLALNYCHLRRQRMTGRSSFLDEINDRTN